MTSLNSKLQLAVLNRKKGRNLLEKGFTLVELMIVIVIVGILSAVALPNFLGTKDKAEAGAQIGSIIGLAKQCSLNAIQESADVIPGTVLTANKTAGQQEIELTPTGGAATWCEGGATMKNTVAYEPEKIAGMRCGAVQTTTANPIIANGTPSTGHTICTITVDKDGAITGAWT
jgi:type IV pilus assembly protein PilA